MPAGADVVLLANSKSLPTEYAVQDMQAAGSTVWQQLSVLHASNNQEINAAFLAMGAKARFVHMLQQRL
jgi:hypothetical protein